ncbi:hypothetical protein VKT23_003720 [Stygiomarasmius scandens]|uniref:Uncharacterized protein n=1 Tax=Marasmiellus scandens TaxID=2682957 RepID=A0ABR1JY46_9AGAR
MAKEKFEALSLAGKNVTFIVDDQDDQSITYLCDVKRQNVSGSFFQNTWTTIDSVNCGAAWFQLKFNGTRAHISSRLSELSTFAVQIDGSPLLRKNGTGVYDTPILNDGEHTVVYAVGNASLFPAFDYATVTAGPSTNLNGKNIIVDDTDNSLEYSGNWAVLLPDTLLVLDPSSAPYKDTTHWASTVGDSVKLTFEGTSISVYRTVPRSTLSEDGGASNITVTYSLDSNTPVNISFPMTSNEPRVVPMSIFLQLDSLSSDASHTLELNLTDIPSGSSSQPGLGLDFITYTAFSPDSNNSNGTVNALGASTDSKLNSGAIAGVVLGSIAFLSILVALVVLVRRRLGRNRQPEQGRTDSSSVSTGSRGSFDALAEKQVQV